jgi:subtilisin family serine protease
MTRYLIAARLLMYRMTASVSTAPATRMPTIDAVSTGLLVASHSTLSHDPLVDAGKSWGLRSLGISPSLLSGSASREPIIVAVLDSGVDGTHEGFADGADSLVTGDKPACTGSEVHCWHGTAVAGIIAARPNSRLGTAGVTPSVRIRSYRITDEGGAISDSRLAAAIEASLASGARVINISASWSHQSAALREALLLAKPGAATAKGALVVVTSPGYLTHSGDQYPGAYADEDEFDFLVAVAGFGMKRLLPYTAASHACKSPLDSKIKWDPQHPDNGYAPKMFAAAGENICTTLPGNRYGRVLGDSFAAPFVSGLAAIAWLQPQYRELNASSMRTILFKGGCDAPAYLKNLAGGAGIHCVASSRFIQTMNCPAFESR